MNASYEWLKRFTSFTLSPAELRDVITARAATVEELAHVRDDLAGIVVGLVVECAPHADSDHLSVTKVDAGTGTLADVVCGAPNVRAGVKYPFAPVGAVLPGGLRIERRKIRGATSAGMLCSARELALGADHDGILPLDTDAAPGTPFLDAYDAGDTRLVIDVLPNRPDLLSHEGLAREVAAYTGAPLEQNVAMGPPHAHVSTRGSSDGVTVTVQSEADAPLFTATVVRGVKVGPSPDWLAALLRAVGLRSINNVVDVTNYMLHGYGQPMHAFDLAKLDGGLLVVRKARDAETITTLDGVSRTLTRDATVVADARAAQGVAGVIGGKGSEVTDSTTDILLEAAVFNPRDVRRTRKALGISTDASYRFERGVDASAIERNARIAARLIVDLAGGAIAGEPVAVGAFTPPASVRLRVSRVARLLGDPVPAAECAQLLSSIGFSVATHDEVLDVTPPGWRGDVKIEADLIEEIARLRGYDSFSEELRPFRVGTRTDSPEYTLSRRVTKALLALGLLEVRPTPFVASAGENEVRVINPLAESESALRTSLLATLGRRAEHNFAHMTRDIRLFEVGTVFERGDGSLPVEHLHAAALITGDRHPAHFTEPKPPLVDAWDAKFVAESVARAAYGDEATVVPSGEGWSIEQGGCVIGSAGRVTLDAPVWAAPVFGIELDLTPALVIAAKVPRHRALPSTPAADFDVALLMPHGVPAAEVERVIRATAGELLESVVPFDEFRGPGVADGFRSVGWRLTLRHPQRTLRDKEIEGRRARILEALDKELGVRPRTS